MHDYQCCIIHVHVGGCLICDQCIRSDGVDEQHRLHGVDEQHRPHGVDGQHRLLQIKVIIICCRSG